MLQRYLAAPTSGRVVLGRIVMKSVWSDMKATELPSWVTRVPHNWGTRTRGKLSADQWRTVCTIHLPVTLIRLWHREGGRKHELLGNFMDLVNAVRIANMRSSSNEQIEAYRRYIQRYAQCVPLLFPDVTIKPTLHAALHIGDMLELYGPLHAISAPFYERYINFLHQIKINNKIGVSESVPSNLSKVLNLPRSS